MLSTEAIAAIVIEPNIEALICEKERHRVQSIHTDRRTRVKQTMLVDDCWSGTRLF